MVQSLPGRIDHSMCLLFPMPHQTSSQGIAVSEFFTISCQLCRHPSTLGAPRRSQLIFSHSRDWLFSPHCILRCCTLKQHASGPSGWQASGGPSPDLGHSGVKGEGQGKGKLDVTVLSSWQSCALALNPWLHLKCGVFHHCLLELNSITKGLWLAQLL